MNMIKQQINKYKMQYIIEDPLFMWDEKERIEFQYFNELLSCYYQFESKCRHYRHYRKVLVMMKELPVGYIDSLDYCMSQEKRYHLLIQQIFDLMRSMDLISKAVSYVLKTIS